jgi:hypothetical protein
MKAFLLITTALVTLGAGPVFAAGYKTMKSSAQAPAARMEAKPPASEPGGCPHNQPSCGGLVQTQNGVVKPPRNAQDAAERPVTANLNREAQQLAGVGQPVGQPMQGQPMQGQPMQAPPPRY